VAADLGPWPPEQATVLVDVLQRAGLQPEAKRTRDGIHVSVPDEQGDQAHQILVANMDVIARAARPAHERGAKRRARSRPASGSDRRAQDPGLATDRLRSLGAPLGVLLVGLFLAMVIRPLMLPLLVGTVAGVIYLLGKQTQRDDERP
jgi:hypothetical protein